MERAAFYFLAAIALLGAAATVTRRSATHAAMTLAPTLFAVAGIFLLHQAVAPFIFLLVIVAGPAASVFFFRKPATNFSFNSAQSKFQRAKISAIFVILLLIAQTAFATFFGAKLAARGLFLLAAPSAANQTTKISEVSHSLFQNYLLPCEIALALILITAIASSAIRGKDA
jgi:NADH-quinone oxidoreductase subunit J